MIGISEELTVIRPGGALSPRCAGVLEAALAGRQAEVLSRLEGPLTGRRLLFVVSLDEGGVNRGFYDLLAHLRTHPNCLDRCVGSVLVDAPGDLYTKAAGRDLVLAAEPDPEVLAQLKEEDKWLMTPFATDALVFVVNQDNPVDSLTVEEIQKIYTGEITNWSQVGGEDLEIAAFQRNQGAGSQTMFEKLVMDGLTPMDPPEAWVSDSMLGLLEGVRSYDNSPAAIGYTVYYYANDMEMAQGLKVLKVDGVAPSAQSIRDGDYPFLNPYFVSIAKDEPEDSPARILYDWVLGPSGQRLAEHEGYVPVTDPEEG
mgnify:CR=1 FL=1